MSTHKHRKLKRHPIVRFIRGVFRLFRILFRPKRTITRLDRPHPVTSTERIDATNFDRDHLVTQARIETTSIDRDRVVIEARIDATSIDRDRLVTVGEIFDQIKWQTPPPSIQKEFTSNSMLFKPNDASRN
jgi:hypothetical protein